MEAKHTQPPDYMQVVAREKAGPDAAMWEVFSWERIGDHKTSRDFVVGLGQTRIKTRGPAKGRRTWRDAQGKMLPNTKVVVTGSEIEAARSKYERDTGHCGWCGGSGQCWSSWSATEGIKYRDCARCGATGKATQ